MKPGRQTHDDVFSKTSTIQVAPFLQRLRSDSEHCLAVVVAVVSGVVVAADSVIVVCVVGGVVVTADSVIVVAVVNSVVVIALKVVVAFFTVTEVFLLTVVGVDCTKVSGVVNISEL